MAKKAQWSRDDIREVKDCARQKTPSRKIARSLKRTARATRQKAFSLGVSLDEGGTLHTNPARSSLCRLRSRRRHVRPGPRHSQSDLSCRAGAFCTERLHKLPSFL